jgi:LuxR family quorum sensing-dependent transcriptional regulator
MTAMAADYGRFAFDVVEDLEQRATPTEVVDCMAAALRRFGFTSFLITDVPDVRSGAKPRWLLNGWPADWAGHYSNENYYKDDPIAAWCRQTVDPFEWSEVRIDAEKNPRAVIVVQAGHAFRRNKGFVVPIYRPDRPMSAVTMCGEFPDFDPHAKRAMHFISLYAYGKAASLFGDDEPTEATPSLTEGEREVLSWMAVGKSAWEISAILDISEPGVVYRVKKAAYKLNAVNGTQAVVNAIRTKQIKI